jgi:hypothetical protein
MADCVDEYDSYNERHCSECEVLTEALRDLEQQCREAEDQRLRVGVFDSSTSYGNLLREEEAYFARIQKLELRRDYALEVLLKHQQLEHI